MNYYTRHNVNFDALFQLCFPSLTSGDNSGFAITNERPAKRGVNGAVIEIDLERCDKRGLSLLARNFLRSNARRAHLHIAECP
jgi:hypothetical protein